jgi:amino acid permease
MIFYVLTILLIGLNGNLFHEYVFRSHNKSISSLGLSKPIQQDHHHFPVYHRLSRSRIQYEFYFPSAFRIAHVYLAVAASFMNTVILTSVLSAGNHALFAGTRVLYGKNITDYRPTI